MFKIYTKEVSPVPVCADCGCFIVGNLYKNYDTKSFFCGPCLEPWLLPEDWAEINQA